MDSRILYPGGAADDDVLSSLPDDVLLRILRFLPTTEDAIRTTALSRRWRHVWLCLPDLSFSDIGKTCVSTPGLPELVNAALAHGHETLKFRLQHPFHKARANAWLQQAAERVAGKIRLRLDDHKPAKTFDYQFRGQGEVVLDLPCGGGVRTAAMSFRSSYTDDNTWPIFRLPAAPAMNSSLTELKLKVIRLEGGSLSDFVSACGQLRRLVISIVQVKDGQVDLRISNKLLEEFDLDDMYGCVGPVEVSCPKLRFLRIIRLFGCFPDCKMVARFCTPCLEEIYWPFSFSLPKSRAEFHGGMDTVRRLTVGLSTHVETCGSHLGPWLLRSCTGIHRLHVHLWNNTKNDADNVVNLMEGLPKLSTVTHLIVTTKSWRHIFGESIAQLLSRCCQLQKLEVWADNQTISNTCPADCPCKRPLNWMKRKLSLDFLKYVDVYYNKNYRVDWIDDLNILLSLSSKANLKMHARET